MTAIYYVVEDVVMSDSANYIYGGMMFDYFHNDADYIKRMISLGYDGVCTFANNTPVLVMFNAENVKFDTVYKSNMF